MSWSCFGNDYYHIFIFCWLIEQWFDRLRTARPYMRLCVMCEAVGVAGDVIKCITDFFFSFHCYFVGCGFSIETAEAPTIRTHTNSNEKRTCSSDLDDGNWDAVVVDVKSTCLSPISREKCEKYQFFFSLLFSPQRCRPFSTIWIISIAPLETFVRSYR